MKNQFNYQHKSNVPDCENEKNIVVPQQATTIKELYDMRVRGCAPNLDRGQGERDFDENVRIEDLSDDVFETPSDINELNDLIEYQNQKVNYMVNQDKEKAKAKKQTVEPEKPAD